MTPSKDASRPDPSQSFAMRISLFVGFGMLIMKLSAYFLTGSAAILSDAAESVVHVVAVSFASYSLRLSFKPSDSSHPFGYDRITFFSAGFEGAMIIIAALYILYESTVKWIRGDELENLGWGTLITVAAFVVNGILGLYLIRKGRKENSLILEANGKHVFTDAFTSGGVIIGLVLTITTGLIFFDPLFAILAALNILKEGIELIRKAVKGLMDQVPPDEKELFMEALRGACEERSIHFHQMKVRYSGHRYWVLVHLIFDDTISLQRAHSLATEIEHQLEQLRPGSVITTHLETQRDHNLVHGHDTSHTV